jgi:CRISPR-associated protein Cst2
MENNNSGISHVAGTFLISAHGAFLNGAGIDKSGEFKNKISPKQFSDGKYKVPYVSAQAWRRWLRETLIEETGWEQSKLRGIKKSSKDTISKIAGELNPIDYAEDDLFGYMKSAENQGKDSKKNNNAKDQNDTPSEEQNSVYLSPQTLIRVSPFRSSILVSLRKYARLDSDEGYVHLEKGGAVPYTTAFYNTSLQGIFGLDMSRLGKFSNIGDRVELYDEFKEKALAEGKIIKTEEENVYALKDKQTAKDRAGKLLCALSVLRGGAKQAAFATDVAPKVIILAGLNCGNLIFNDLFEDNPNQMDADGPKIKIDVLKEIASDYNDRLTTPIYIGIRNGYLSSDNESEVSSFVEKNCKSFIIGTPIEVTKMFTSKHLNCK